MKKISIITFLTFLTLLCFFPLVCAAANNVQITATDVSIIKADQQVTGSVTFSFDAGSEIRAGDEWYFDLPPEVSISSGINYLITGGGVENCSGFIDISKGVDSVYFAGHAKGIASTPIAPGASAGPCSVTSLGGAAADTTATGNVFIKVYAEANSQRVGLYVYGDSADAKIIVGNDTTFNIVVLDGKAYADYIVMDRGTGLNGNEVYGDSIFDGICTCADIISQTDPVPHIENLLRVNAELMTGDILFASFSSKNNKFTATSGPSFQIAKIISMDLKYCDGTTTGDIKIWSSGSCKFNYQTGEGYDPDVPFSGDYLYIEASAPFGDAPGDHYDIIIKSLTDGVYFSTTPVIKAFTGDTGICEASGGTEITANFSGYKQDGTQADYPDPDACIVEETKRVREVRTNNGNITGINAYNRLRVELPDMVYDANLVIEGMNAKIQIILKKYNGETGVEFLNAQDIIVGNFTVMIFPVKVPDTGQDDCYGGDYSTDPIPCPGPGEDWHGQDANYTINPPRYENIDYPNGIKAVKDNATGLIWEVKQNFDSVRDYTNPSDADNVYTWYDPDPATNGGFAGYEGEYDTQDFLALLKDKSGKTDWRLPKVHELMFLLDYKNRSPIINTEFFPNTNIGYSFYWTAITSTSNIHNAWTVDFVRGNNLDLFDKSNKFTVRAVRGTGMSFNMENRFRDNQNHTVSDNYTGLMWEQKTPENKNDKIHWNEALSYCENLNLGGFSDWHLPNVNELLSLVDFTKNNAPVINTDFFPNTYRDQGDGSSHYYWTATPISYPKRQAFHIDFESGKNDINNGDRVYAVNCVRCVRWIKKETGDLNHDSKVDFKDAISGLRVMAGMTGPDNLYRDTTIEGYNKISLENVIYILQDIVQHR